MIQRELDRYLPFLATTKVLIAAVRAGMGREAAHEVIKEHAVAVALAMRERAPNRTCWIAWPPDPRLPLDRSALDEALADKGGVHRFGRRPGGPGRRRGERVGECLSGRRQVHARRDPLKSMSLRTSISPIWTTSPTVSRTTCSRSTAAMRRCTGARPTENTPTARVSGRWPPTGNPCRASRCGHLFVGDRRRSALRWHPVAGPADRGSGAQHDGRSPAHPHSAARQFRSDPHG